MMNNILILGASQYIVPLILQAKKMGYITHVCSNQENDPGLLVADFSYNISILDKNAIVELFNKIKPTAVTTAASDLATINVGYLNRTYNLKGITDTQVFQVSNKGNFVKLQQKLDLPLPKSYIVNEKVKLEEIIDQISYPAIMKPFFASGSRGIMVVNNAEELRNHHQVCVDSSSDEKGYVVQDFLKDYIDISCECFIENGQVVFMEASEKFLNKRNVPIGHLVPNILNIELRKSIINQLEMIAKELNISNTPVNIDVLIHEEKAPVIVDISFRLGGNMMPDIMHQAFNSSPYKRVLEYILKDNFETFKKEQEIKFIGGLIFGVGSEMIFTEEIKSQVTNLFNNVELLDLKFDIKEGETINKFEQGNKRFGHALVKTNSVEDYKKLISNLKEITQNY